MAIEKFDQKALYAFAGQGVAHMKSLRDNLVRKINDKNCREDKRESYKAKLKQVDDVIRTLGK